MQDAPLFGHFLLGKQEKVVRRRAGRRNRFIIEPPGGGKALNPSLTGPSAVESRWDDVPETR